MLTLQNRINKTVGSLKRKLGPNNENSTFYLLIFAMAVVFIGGINIFLELAEALSQERLFVYDYRIQQYIIGFRDPGLTPLVTFITDLGDRYAYFVVIGLMGLVFSFKKRWQLVLEILFVSGISALATVVLKNNYQRERPGIEHLVEIGGLSFPSGHSLSAMAFYGFVIYLIWRYLKSGLLKWFLSLFCVALILAIGLSRIYLGVHYPSDVAAGFVGGLIWASFCIIFFNIIDLWRKRLRYKRELNSEELEED